jgi:acetoin utilization deacetylase AcuC-like enzyme
MPTGFVYDPISLRHENPPGHPERVERLKAAHAALESSGLLAQLTPVSAEAVSEADHVDAICALVGEAGYLDSDTYYSPESVKAALKAAGGTVALAEKVFRGELQNGFALVRPPGHHAEAGRAMGFCLFNNIAVAAAAVREAGARRVAIYDWDVHHGNGTQHSFEANPDVLYLSTHEYPFYPGTGGATEVGKGAGRGATVNFPMPAGSGDPEYLTAIDAVIAPAIELFQPDMLLISAGFDTYVDDPLAGMRVTADGFVDMARRMRALADRVCGGKIVYVLEGGYDLDGLAAGVTACIEDLVNPRAPRPSVGETTPAFRNALEAVKQVQSEFWTLR